MLSSSQNIKSWKCLSCIWSDKKGVCRIQSYPKKKVLGWAFLTCYIFMTKSKTLPQLSMKDSEFKTPSKNESFKEFVSWLELLTEPEKIKKDC